MNEFLEKHNYRLYEGDKLLVVKHYNSYLGCIHAIFIGIVSSLFLMSIFIYQVVIIALLAVVIYIIEFDRRKKQASKIHIDFSRYCFILKKGKKETIYPFSNVMQVVSTSEHMGGYSSSHRSTTEEYKREINILFKDGFIMTVFSLISDYKTPEKEIDKLVAWLESIVRKGNK